MVGEEEGPSAGGFEIAECMDQTRSCNRAVTQTSAWLLSFGIGCLEVMLSMRSSNNLENLEMRSIVGFRPPLGDGYYHAVDHGGDKPLFTGGTWLTVSDASGTIRTMTPTLPAGLIAS